MPDPTRLKNKAEKVRQRLGLSEEVAKLLGDWADMRKLGDWKVAKILAHPLGEPRDVTHDPGPVPSSVDGQEVVVHSTVRAPDDTWYYACSWRYLARDPFLLTYDTVTVKHADGTVVGSVDWVGDK